MGQAGGAPRMWNRLAARLRREVPNGPLEAFRRAGAAVHVLRLEVDRRLADLVALERHPWSAEPGAASAALCVSNALVLQTIGEALLDEDYAASPKTRGYLPPVTAEQAWACFERVGAWLGWARQGLTAGAWNLRVEIELPAELAVWVHDDDYPPQHVRALLVAAGRVAEQLDAACGVLATAGEPEPGLRELLRHARGVNEGLHGRLEHAATLWQADAPDVLLQQVLEESRALLAEQFVLGQVLAAAPLVEQHPARQRPAQHPARPAAARQHPAGQWRAAEPYRPQPVPLPGPGQPGFDPWCLTCPQYRASARHDPAARQAIAELWQHDPQPARTLGIQGQIDAALRDGAIRHLYGNGYRQDGDRVQGAFHACPWGAIYEVLRPVEIAGTRFDVLAQFTYQVSAELFPQTGTFIRRLLPGPFVFTGPIVVP